MKKWAISLCMLIFLTGCSAASEIERGMALRSALLKAESCSMDAIITADYGDTSCTFTMVCSFDSQGKMAFRVREPESICGITGQISDEAGKLIFDDTVLYFDLLADGQLSPIAAPWIVMKTLRSGYLASGCMEDSLLRLTMDDSFEENELTLDIWLNSENTPVCGEILFQGRRILSLNVENFRIM